MAKILRDKNGRIPLMDGWSKDDEGQIFDPDGFKWYGHKIQGSTGDVSPKDQAIIADPGTGDQRVIRFFDCKHPLDKVMPPKDEVLRAMWSYITTTIFRSGLTTDDNREPIVHQDARTRTTMIMVICKPSNRRASIYDGMKHGEGGVHNIDGQMISAHKTDNISTLLRASSKNPEQSSKDFEVK